MLPTKLRDKYSMNGIVQICENYESNGLNRTYYHYSFELVENFINYARNKSKNQWLEIDEWLYDRSKSRNYYPETDAWLYEALEKYSISKKEILILDYQVFYQIKIRVAAESTDKTLCLVPTRHFTVIQAGRPPIRTIDFNGPNVTMNYKKI